MAWLRIDDGFAQHPKFEGWSVKDKWALIELLLYCARHKTDGYVPDDLALLPRAVNRALLGKAEAAGFLERDVDHLVVHDWRDYNPADPTAADRMQRHRTRRNEKRNESRNESVSSRARLPSRPKETSNEVSREPDELWEALVAELGEPATKSERGRFNSALKELREVATPRDIHARCKAYRRKWPDIALTPQALTNNWTQLEPPPVVVIQPIAEVLDIPEISDEERTQNIKRLKALNQSLGRTA